ncbi:hypothetical protein HK405_000412, partial [Cladochytrium tenue]
MDSCSYLPLAHSVAAAVWDRVVAVAVSLLVPGLDEYEGGREKRVWDEARVIFLRIAIDTLFEFLVQDGDGVPAATLRTPDHARLQSLLDVYSAVPSRRDLEDRHRRLLAELLAARAAAPPRGDGLWAAAARSDDERALDWLLRLIRLRGGWREYVEPLLLSRYL